jgi:predicted phage terminase large subunit-like protein
METARWKSGREDLQHTAADLAPLIAPYFHKMAWFLDHGYEPHYWQTLFHTATNPVTGHIARFRNLVAGRRGGKTFGAAEEVVYYALNPDQFFKQYHGREDERGLHIWILTPDYTSTGRAALHTVRAVLRTLGLRKDKDYRENMGDRWIEFPNGSILEFKTAERPDKLVGAGLDILWMDESAVIDNDEAWNIARPAISDKIGMVVTSTTPRDKNWYYKLFWSDAALLDPAISSVEYWSIDNPYFPKSEWEYVKETYHPLLFMREYMASFDAMAGVELPADWLNYYQRGDLPKKEDGSYDLNIYIGVDPAVSLSDKADHFALAVLGVTHDSTQVYLLELYMNRIQFPEQVDLIESYHKKYRPIMIGIEKGGYQESLAQQMLRLESFPPVEPVPAVGQKKSRILSMSPLFKMGKILIHKDMHDFVSQWINYDSSRRNPEDDALDAVEIALRVAGIILPGNPETGETLTDPWLIAAKKERDSRMTFVDYDPVIEGDQY